MKKSYEVCYQFLCTECNHKSFKQDSKNKADKDIDARRTQGYRSTAGRQVTLQKEGERTRGKEGGGALERKGSEGIHGRRSKGEQNFLGLTETGCWKENSIMVAIS